MIEVQQLTKYYGLAPAVQDVSFTVEKGEILGFLGPNGAGKTTTMRIITCFLPATSGTVRVAGYDVFNDSLKVRREIGYLPENVPLYGDMYVTEYLAFVASVKGVPPKERKKKVDAAIDACGLKEVRHKLIRHCSKGYKQRVGLAQAIVNGPKVLILDEPTVGLDPRQIIEIRSLIRELAHQSTIILSTHILPEVSMTCSRVVIINKGRVVAQDTPEHLTSSLQKSQQFVLTVDGPPPQVQAALRGLSGVLKVQGKDGGAETERTYTLEIAKDRDIRRDIAATVVKNSWGLLEFKSVGKTLEDIFVELVTEEPNQEPVQAEAV